MGLKKKKKFIININFNKKKTKKKKKKKKKTLQKGHMASDKGMLGLLKTLAHYFILTLS